MSAPTERRRRRLDTDALLLGWMVVAFVGHYTASLMLAVFIGSVL